MFPSKILWEIASRTSIEVLSIWQTCPYGPLISNTMTSIRSYFSGCSKATDTDRIILAPSSISPRRNDVADDTLIGPDEFKLNGKQYVRCCVFAKRQKHNKKRTSIVWMHGEDIQRKQNPTKRFWYCY